MILGYNTNGFAHHDPFDAMELLAEVGYRSVGLTIDHHCLSPYSPAYHEQQARMAETLARLKLRSVIETGARFLLDRYVKHEPTLMTADRQRRDKRIDFYRRCIDLAAELRSDCVSLWSGILRDDIGRSQALDRLIEALKSVLDYAGERNVLLGFEPEPGMFIDTMARFEELQARIGAPHLRLTLDVGHLHCQGETPLEEQIARWASQLVNVHLEDMRQGVHEHLPFGEGEIDFAPLLNTLQRCYSGGVHVELSRHSHRAPEIAHESWRFLTSFLGVSP